MQVFPVPSPRARAHSMGFTLVELMIVIAVVAIIASIAIPNLLSARKNANESAAIATLKSLISTQAGMQGMGAMDVNNNGRGEFGFFAELAGVSPLRVDQAGGIGGAPVTPQLMPAFGNVINGRVPRSGYFFRVYLPATGTGAPAGEAATGGASGVSIDAALAESIWCAYAWPASYGNSGSRTFFINHNGDILSTRNTSQRYSGDGNPVPPNAAFRAGTPDLLGSPPAANALGKDGEPWTVVQ